MTITLSHGGPSIYSSASRSDSVAVGTINGVAFIERNGDGWRVSHRGLEGKHIHAVVVEPTSGTIFAGANHGSIFASADGGHTWEQRDNGLTETDVYSMEATVVNGKARIFAGTEPAHLFASDDLGQTWNELKAMRSVDMSKWGFPAPPHIAHTKHINFHPKDPQTLYVGVEQGGLLKSTDSGETFTVIHGMDDDVHRSVLNPADPDEIFVTTGIGMYYTGDGGANWDQWTDTNHPIGGYPDLLVLHPRNPSLMFVASAEFGPGTWRETGTATSRISKSTDGGRTWTQLKNGINEVYTAFEAMCIEDWGGDSFSVFAATATGEVWNSDDGGESWHEILSDLAPISKGAHYESFVKVTA